MLRRAVAAVSILACTMGGVATYRQWLPADRTLVGLKIEGLAIPSEVSHLGAPGLVQWLQARVDAAQLTVAVEAGPARRQIVLRDFGRLAFDRAAGQAMEVGRAGALGRRLSLARRARRGEVDIELPVDIEIAKVEELVEALSAEIEEAPVDARLDLANHAVVPDRRGRALERWGAREALEQGIARAIHDALRGVAPRSIELPWRELTAPTTSQTLASLDISQVVASFDTYFSRNGDQAPRAINIENAARKLDGLIVPAAGVVSFNEVVGERSEANGFKMAWEIFKGEMRPGVGGGTCQVASTLHAAAFFAGLDVLERLPHSRPSAYIPMGLDSTVVFPVVDLKLRNPHPFQVVIHTEVKGSALHVEVLGPRRPYRVTFAREVVDTYPFQRKIEEDAGVSVGKAIRKQGGIRGYKVRRVRTFVAADGGAPRQEVSYDHYPPTTEIYRVAPGTDPNDLPPLPPDVVEALAKRKAARAGAGADPGSGEGGGERSGEPSAATGSEADTAARVPLEVRNAAGVHDLTGDQLEPRKTVSIAR